MMAFSSQFETSDASTFEIAVLPTTGVRGGIAFSHAVARANTYDLLDVTQPRQIEVTLEQLRRIQNEIPAARLGARVEYSLAALWHKAFQKQDAKTVANSESSNAARTLDLLIVAGAITAKEKTLVTKLKTAAKRVFREVVSIDEAQSAQLAGYDGIIAKGNESGGRVGGESTFILLQRLVRTVGATEIPIWVQGGVGPDAAAACRVAGASGVLLDVQLALATESNCPENLRVLLEAMDGTETVCLGESLGAGFRVHRRVASTRVDALQKLEHSEIARDEFEDAVRSALAEEATNAAEANEDGVLWPVGQDAALAAPLAARYGNVARILRAYRKASLANLRIAAEQEVLGASGALARAHKTTTAIVQGPMTRVSDVAPFANEVATGGGLPFLALAMLREKAVDELLAETSALLGKKSWGVGILGFVPAELRAEQMNVVMRYKPPFALLAGGRADQAKKLEDAGIKTYLHAPTPRLLRMFLDKGARRFVFEGRECGGHVGPLSSFLLWQQAVETIRQYQQETNARESVDVLFAGGIHDALSAAMATAVAASLLEQNVRFGVLMGTAYLFTLEAVQAGAISASFQDEAISCAQTALLDASGGHAIRCAPTAYVEEYSALKRRLLQQGVDPAELRRELEELNVGRLRLASKGTERRDGVLGVVEVSLEEQKQRGMYMIGSVAALRDEVLPIRELHDDVALGSAEVLRARNEALHAAPVTINQSTPTPIAIIGLSAMYPDAPDLDALWRNILRNHDAIREVSPERWDAATYYEAGTTSPDRIISKWGGFLSDLAFDPMRYGIPPSALSSIEPNQLLTLEAMRSALHSAGYDESTRALPRERTGIIIGTGGGISDLSMSYTTRCMAEKFFHESGLDAGTREAAIAALRRATPAQTEDSFPGTLTNVIAGRVANRFGLGGLNCTVDAACASSMAAVETAIKELRSGNSDAMLVGGVDTQQSAMGFLSFSTTKALSPRGRCRPFDATADGIAISEGIGAILIKRLDDAIRDGDPIFAVIRDVAAGSDGREKSLTAPASAGQRRAISRAYKNLEFSPADVELVEAHGTGTVLGDRTEMQSIRAEWEAAGAKKQSVALGSIKSQIGHTKNAAGLAGIIKSTLALHHRVLPPTLVGTPSDAIRDREQPLYLNTRPRPWFKSDNNPRRAAASAFGFGGTNFHLALEEYSAHATPTAVRSAELFAFRAASREALKADLQTLETALREARDDWRLIDLAATLTQKAAKARGEHRLAIVARDKSELLARVQSALQSLEQSTPAAPGVAMGEGSFDGKIAMLFPGQGSQSLEMLGELAIAFPVVRETFERADRALDGVLPSRLTSVIFPPPAYSPEEESEQRAHLNQTWLAQPALGAADYAMFALLQEFGLAPDFLGGHSYGEYVALCAAGVFDFETLMRLSEQRGRIAQATQGNGEVGMIAVRAGIEALQSLLEKADGVSIAAQNAPQQTILGGRQKPLDEFCKLLDAAKINYQKLAVSAGFHIPEASEAARQFREVLASTPLLAPSLPVYANLTAAPHQDDAAKIRETLTSHLVKPLQFRRQIEAMRDAGAALFLEVGPKTVLSGLAEQTLQETQSTPTAAKRIIATNRGASAMTDFLEAVAQLFASGVAVKLPQLFAGIEIQPLTVQELKPRKASPMTWLVNGGSARPLHAPKKIIESPTSKEAPRETSREASLETSRETSKVTEKPAQNIVQNAVQNLQNTSTPVSSLPVSSTSVIPQVIPAMNVKSEAQLAAPVVAAPAATSRIASAPVANAQTDAALALFQESMRQFLAYQAESQRQRQELMTRFLETQQAVLQTYLGAAPTLPQSTPAPVASQFALPQLAAPQPIIPQPVVAQPVIPQAPTAIPQAMIPQPVVAPFIAPAPATNGSAPQIPPREVQSPPVESTPVAVSPVQSTPVGSAPVESASVESASVAAEVVAAPKAEVDLRATVLNLVSERTGYPVEMLDLDHNMEADLGIDSIKRTEIFGGLREELGLAGDGDEQEEYFIQIAALRTLREVLDWLEEMMQEAVPSTPALNAALTRPPVDKSFTAPAPAEIAEKKTQFDGLAERNANVKRLVIRPTIESLSAEVREFNYEQVALVTEDAGGRAREVVTGLRVMGAHVATVRHSSQTRIVEPGVYEADLFSRQSVEQLRDWILEHEGAISMLSHLLPLDPPPGNPDDALEVRSLFHLASVFGPQLQENRGTLTCVTGLGGDCGFEIRGSTPAFRPGAAALSGMLKTLALEWPDVFIKAIDVDTTDDEEFLLPQLMGEVSSEDRTVEAGHSSRGRVVPRGAEELLDVASSPNITLDKNSVIFVTGGARGITGAICVEMARRFGSRFVLVGRAELPEETDAATPEEFRARELRRARENGELLTPVQIEARVQKILRGREMRETLAQIQEYSAHCEYHSLDVRDTAQLETLLRDVKARLGRIDGVIHGAGVIEDALLLAKQPESFGRVFDTKVLPATTLARIFDEPEFSQSLQFLLFFSSVSAHFGNPGQTDYAAANQALSKLACSLDARWNARVAAIGWGPWSEIGMASPHLRDKLAAAGFDYLAPHDGVQMCIDELLFGRKGQSALLIYTAHESAAHENQDAPGKKLIDSQYLPAQAAPIHISPLSR